MAEWQLPSSLSEYVNKQFSDFTDDATLEESILAHNPVAENVKALKAPKADTYLNDIFKTSNRPLDLQVDEGLRRVQQRLLNTMGPVTKVWALIDAIRDGKSETLEVDTFKLLELIEQSITLLEQSNVALNQHRRLLLMTRVLKSQKRVKQILKENKEYFRKAHSALFGFPFTKRCGN